jgi:protein-L-isoaspartate(D-aspartate) O-methyltransferase
MDSIRWLLLIVLALIGSVCGDTLDDPYAAQRRRMVRMIDADVKATSARLGEPALEVRVLDAMGSVPRHEFVPADLRHLAYANRPLPIGYGQTISQPYIVAVMTALLDVDNEDIVLEVGTGSGYQAAVLAELVQRVYSIEIIPELAQRTQKQLRRLGYDNIETRVGDGYYGWEEHAPFDAIIVTAAAPRVPEPLKQQLKDGGRLVIPVGDEAQELMVITRKGDTFEERRVLPVRFVPMTGKVRKE